MWVENFVQQSLPMGSPENPPASPMPIFMKRGAAQRHGGSVGAARWVRSARLFPPPRSGLPSRRWLRSAHRLEFARRAGWLGKSPHTRRAMPSRNHEEWWACRHTTGRFVRRGDVGSPTARLASGTGLTLIRIANELRPFAPGPSSGRRRPMSSNSPHSAGSDGSPPRGGEPSSRGGPLGPPWPDPHEWRFTKVLVRGIGQGWTGQMSWLMFGEGWRIVPGGMPTSSWACSQTHGPPGHAHEDVGMPPGIDPLLDTDLRT